MKKYISVVVIAFLAMTTYTFAQCAHGATGKSSDKHECSRQNTKECKMDSTACCMLQSRKDVDTKMLCCKGTDMTKCKDHKAMRMNHSSEKCDTTMCAGHASNCREMKDCPKHK